MAIRGLTTDQSSALAAAMKKRESSNNYSNINPTTKYVGAYQFGTVSLKDLGLIKASAPNANSALNDANNWVGDMNLQKFLANKDLQDQLFERYANLNYSRLKTAGVIANDSTPATIAGYLSAAHLVGWGGAKAFSKGQNKADASGTTAKEYFALGAAAVGGAADSPAAGTGGSGTGANTNTGNQAPQKPTIPTPTKEVVTIDAMNVRPNVLGQFASYSPIFTLSVLSINEYNECLYKENRKNYGKIIARSGGGLPDNRVSTANTSWYNPEGKFDYYIDNVVIKSLMTYNTETIGTNAIKITFDVTEPFSMGLFLQSLELASFPEFKDFKDAPLLLTVEFIGWDQDGNQIPVADELDRHFPIKIIGMDLTVNGGKSVYSITAMPYNEQSLTDVNIKFKEDVTISGSTVQELTSNLTSVVNTSLKKIAESATNTTGLANTIAIGFPQIVYDSSKPIPTDINDIGKASMGFDLNTGGECRPTPENIVFGNVSNPPDRSKIVFDSTSRSFRFPQGTSIAQALTSVVLMSQYCKDNALKSEGSFPGMKKWFRIETELKIMSDDAYSTGTVPKFMLYNIVPYEVHEHRIAPPNNIPAGYTHLVKEVIKSYDYLYTGQNTEIVRFDLKYNAIAFTTVYADKNAYNKDSYAQGNSQGVGPSNSPAEQLANTPANINDAPGGVSRGTMESRAQFPGAPPSDYKALIAKNFHDALLRSPIDQIQVDLEIWGDPYYLADSGLGNYTDPSISFNLTENGSMNYRNAEVDILIIYRSPNDIDPATGIADFGSSTLAKTFTGLYQILNVESTFRNGKFTQVLHCMRRPMQQIDEILTPKDPDPGLSLPFITYVPRTDVPGCAWG